MDNKDKGFMLLAIKTARLGIRRGQSPFGAVIVKKGKIICSAHNTVWKDKDSTKHAEIAAIRKAEKKLRSIDLKGCTIYSTCEPCPMCFSACHWAKIDRIVYGARIKDAEKLGFRELKLSDKRLDRITKSRIKIDGSCLRQENLQLMKDWSRLKKKKTY